MTLYAMVLPPMVRTSQRASTSPIANMSRSMPGATSIGTAKPRLESDCVPPPVAAA